MLIAACYQTNLTPSDVIILDCKLYKSDLVSIDKQGALLIIEVVSTSMKYISLSFLDSLYNLTTAIKFFGSSGFNPFSSAR